MRYKAIIFDLDGTLLNTLDDLADSVNMVLKEHSFPVHDVEAYKLFVGDGAFELISRALPESNRESEFIKNLVNQFQAIYNNLCLAKTRPYDNIINVLKELQRRNIILNILSNKPHQFTVSIVNHYFGEINFSQVWGEKSDFPRKPNPASALEISKLIDIAPSEIIFVGDSIIDIKTAIAAGMYPVGVSWGYHNVKKLEDAAVKLIIDKPENIFNILD
ncbi:MAG: hypothetical protein A2033_00935 [Bacteroidetes bacterium GWA2_31_9]|nr:MAG: hypothetical protein A2033_00935 [Bacteroidetes bacterium GWA2_31_9]